MARCTSRGFWRLKLTSLYRVQSPSHLVSFSTRHRNHQRQGHGWPDCCQPEGEFSVLILLDSSLAFDIPHLPAIIFQFTQFINLLLFEEGVVLTSRLAEGDFQLLTITFVSQIPGSQVCSTVSSDWFHILCVRICGIQELYCWATPHPPLCSRNNSPLGHLEPLWILPPCPAEAPICSWELGKALVPGPCSSVCSTPVHAPVKRGNTCLDCVFFSRHPHGIDNLDLREFCVVNVCLFWQGLIM